MPSKVQIADINIDNLIYGSDLIDEVIFRSAEYDFKNSVVVQQLVITTNDNIDIRSVVPIGPTYFNHNTVIEIPTDTSFMKDQENHKQTNFFRIDNDYLYDANEYYDFTKNIDHRSIPSVYLSSYNQSNSHEMEFYVPFGTNIDSEKIINFPDKMRPFYRGPTSEIIQKHSQFFFGSEYSFGLGNSNLSSFPWHNKVAFSAVKEQKILNCLKSPQIRLYDKIVKDHMDYPKTTKSFEINGFAQDVEMVDLAKLIKGGSSVFSNEQMVFLPKQPSLSRIEEATARWSAALNISSIGLQSIRNIEDMYDEDLCGYEYLYFKIEKYSGSNTNLRPVQVYNILNTTGDVIFTDTQIKPRESYTYVVKAYILLHGSEYQYTLLSQDQFSGKTVSHIEAIIRPSLKVIEIPLFEKNVTVTKKPPIPPFVKFINKSNSTNKIRILLDLQKGEQISNFIPITENDSAILPFLKGAADGPIEFEYSKQAGKFEIFKSYTKITDYSRYDTSYVAENNKQRPHIVLSENLRPNRKYYFFFRTINKFDLPSNPSPIYEVELLKDSDDSKVVVRTIKVQSDANDTHQNDIKFGQFIQIMPAFSQVQVESPDMFDYETHKGFLRQFRLGYADTPLWGRKFKFRITSNNTGRKIDFNLIFDIVKRESEENLK